MPKRSKGFTLTNQYQRIYDGKLGGLFEIWNESGNDAHIIIGNQTLNEADSKLIKADSDWYSTIELDVPVFARGSGKILVIADQ